MGGYGRGAIRTVRGDTVEGLLGWLKEWIRYRDY